MSHRYAIRVMDKNDMFHHVGCQNCLCCITSFSENHNDKALYVMKDMQFVVSHAMKHMQFVASHVMKDMQFVVLHVMKHMQFVASHLMKDI